jgi:hypothetical protein
MSVIGMHKFECQCGQFIVVLPPEASQHLQDTITGVGAAVFICNKDTDVCPTCGHTYTLPSAEIFDVERSPLLRRLAALDDTTP